MSFWENMTPPSKKMELVLPQLDEFMRSQQKSSTKPRYATSTVCHNTMEQIFEDSLLSLSANTGNEATQKLLQYVRHEVTTSGFIITL